MDRFKKWKEKTIAVLKLIWQKLVFGLTKVRKAFTKKNLIHFYKQSIVFFKSLGTKEFWKSLWAKTKSQAKKMCTKKYWIDLQRKFEDFKNKSYLRIDLKTRENLEYVVELEDLHLSYQNPAKPEEKNKVIRGVSLKLKRNEILAIIGESGSGKSVITSAMYGLAGENARIDQGKIKILGEEVQNFSFKDWERKGLRGVGISAVFQNPMTTLNPTMKIGKQVMEGLLVNRLVEDKKAACVRALELLKLTRINDPEKVMEMYPHELSGGMKQRVVIAAIVAMQPKILVLDEPTTALDPTVQAFVLDIIMDLKNRFNMSIIFITHDLGVVASLADRIAIMYAGQIIEIGKRDEIMWNPRHPYTWGLLSSMPDVNQGARLQTIRGSVPASLNNIVGEAFAPRNSYAMGIDFEEEAPFFRVSDSHFAKTWLLDKSAPSYSPPSLIVSRWKEFEKMKGVNHGKTK